MADLVAERGGEFGLVVEQRQQSARHHHVAAGGVGIGQRLVEHDEAIAAGNAGAGDQGLADTVDIGLQLGIGIGRPDLALEFARQDRDAGPRAGGRRSRRRDTRRSAGGDPGDEREKDEKATEKHCPSRGDDRP